LVYIETSPKEAVMAAAREARAERPRKKAILTKRHRATATPKGKAKGAATGPTPGQAKAEFLGLSRRWAAPSIEDVAQIREGLAVKTLEGLNDVLPGVTYRIVPKSTLATLKRRSDRLPPEQSNRVYQAGKVVGFAMEIYRDEDKVREFLTRRHPMLKDQRPLDVALESGAGADMVVNLLGRGAYGGGA
jgi:putative toxin-antitoxin system antitoxin component (TIGR02293 family)